MIDPHADGADGQAFQDDTLADIGLRSGPSSARPDPARHIGSLPHFGA